MADTDRIDKEIKFGWKPPLPNFKTIHLESKFLEDPANLPFNFDPTGLFMPDSKNIWPDVYDQGQEGSCTANAGAGLVEFNCLDTAYPWTFKPSRSFIYYNTRKIEGTENQDSGATVSDTLDAIATFGVCPEDGNPAWSMPYVAGQYATAPTEAMYKDALLHCALEHQQVPQNDTAIKSLLCNKKPIEIGFTVYSSFMTQGVAKSGVMPVPGLLDWREGGHAVDVVGYLTNYTAGNQGIVNWAIVRNSWGKTWGRDGYFLMPWDKVLLSADMASDFHAITQIGFNHKPIKGNMEANIECKAGIDLLTGNNQA